MVCVHLHLSSLLSTMITYVSFFVFVLSLSIDNTIISYWHSASRSPNTRHAATIVSICFVFLSSYYPTHTSEHFNHPIQVRQLYTHITQHSRSLCVFFALMFPCLGGYLWLP